jgi:hypothetical protein
MSNGRILYHGPSLFDGADIVCIAIGLEQRSSNRKTGGMLQTYVLRADMSPVLAVKLGLDSSVCFDCAARGDGTGKGRWCYVNLGQGPRSVWDAFNRGIYPAADDVAAVGAGRNVRVGTYGDPAAVPVDVWGRLLSRASGHTGYTHQWRTAPALAAFCMASADSAADKSEAWGAGWRTFRVADMPGEGEIECPSSRGVQCTDCRLCDGAGAARSITIPAHGPGAKYAPQPAA